jgi:aryl-alcohol dehydrogenase-like predicted oxidoreductase
MAWLRDTDLPTPPEEHAAIIQEIAPTLDVHCPGMPFRRIEIPTLNRTLSNVMAHPSSADPDSHKAGLEQYLLLGGNCIHLHGEGGESHSRRATGRWLAQRGLRPEFFLCTQICHDGWDEAAGVAIDRFTAAAVAEDINADLELLGTEYLDFVYLDDNPQASFQPVLEAIGSQIESGRLRSFGVRNWEASRLTAAQEYLSSATLPPIAAIVTTELALASTTAPLWPEYVAFEPELRQAVEALHLPVFAHAHDINIGQCLYGAQAATAGPRRHWVERWNHPANGPLVQRVQQYAATHELTPREVNLAWLLGQPFPCIAVTPLPYLLMEGRSEYERASQLRLSEPDRDWLRAPLSQGFDPGSATVA